MQTPIIQINNLNAKYGDKHILKNISASIKPGKITVILGTSGCGKTTLVKNILRLNTPASGKVSIFNKDVTNMPQEDFEEILKQIGMLFQNGALLNSISIYDNLAIPLEQHTNLPKNIIQNMIKVKLQLVGLKNAMWLLPSELSGGMKKRAALARAIILDPKLLICDEPSAGLDPLTSAKLDTLVLKLKKELAMSIVIVTHELASIFRIADEIIFLDKGEMLYFGSLDGALKSNIPQVLTFFETGKF